MRSKVQSIQDALTRTSSIHIPIKQWHSIHATYAQISNFHRTLSVSLTINETATITIPAATTQVFNHGDIDIDTLELTSSHDEPIDVEVLYVVRPTSNI